MPRKNLAELLRATNRPIEAEPLIRRALAIDEASYGADHPSTQTVRNNLLVHIAALRAMPRNGVGVDPPPPPKAQPIAARLLALGQRAVGWSGAARR